MAADGQLTIRAGEGTIRQALDAIADTGGFRLVIYGGNDFPIPEPLNNVPLVEGIKRLLGEANYAMVFDKKSGKGTADTTLKKLIVNLEPRPAAVVSGTTSPGGNPDKTTDGDGNPQPLPPAELRAELARLADPDSENRMSAIQALAGSNDASALPALADTTRKDSDARIRAAAAMALGGRGERTAIPPLVQAAGDNDPWVRVNAIEALAQIGGDEVIPYVRKAQSDADADVANAAVMALRELPGAERGDTAP